MQSRPKKLKSSSSYFAALTGPPVELWRRLLAAFAFLTLLPLPVGKSSARTMGGSTAFFPLVGAALGASTALLGVALDAVLPASVTNVFLVAFLAGATGGLHLDGLADTADGLLGGKDRPHALRIMRRGDIGAFGAAVLALALLAKFASLDSLTGGERLPVLVAVLAVSRWLMVIAATLFPSARARGLGATVIRHTGTRELVVATALTLAFVAPVGPALVSVVTGALLFAMAFGHLIVRRLGGMTGDTLGALAETGELFAFVMILVAWR